MVRTQVAINGRVSYLAQGQDLQDLKQRIVAAMAAGGRFVDFVVVGNREMSVLIAAKAEVMFSVETVPFDPRDTGDQAIPYGGRYDL